MATVPVKLAALEMVWPLIKPEVMVLEPMLMLPKPLAMLPLLRAPVLVILPWTAVGSVWVRPGTLEPLVARMLLAAAPVTCKAPVPLP